MTHDGDRPPPEPRLLAAPIAGRVLAFAPHPDDEVAGPGGTLWLHRRQGDPVRVVIATDGIAGDPDDRYEKATYAELRRSESRRGLRELDVEDVVFWGFPDSCQLSDQDMEWGTRKAAEEIERFRPDVVYLPWGREGHPDHHATHVCVARALHRTGFRGTAYGYEVWHAMIPDLIVDITPAIDRKRRAIAQHESQLAYASFDHCILGLNAYRSLIHLRGRGYGEAFQVLHE